MTQKAKVDTVACDGERGGAGNTYWSRIRCTRIVGILSGSNETIESCRTVFIRLIIQSHGHAADWTQTA